MFGDEADRFAFVAKQFGELHLALCGTFDPRGDELVARYALGKSFQSLFRGCVLGLDPGEQAAHFTLF